MSTAGGPAFGKARFDIEANLAPLNKQLKEAGPKMAPHGKEIAQGVNDGFGKGLEIDKIIKGAFAGLAAVASVAVIKSLATEIDQLAKDSQRLGIAIGALSEMSYAADLSGASISEMNAGIRVLSKNMQAAADGSSSMQDFFKRAGVEYKNQAGGLREVDDVLGDLAATFAAMSDSAQKTALAMNLMGRSGTALIPYLNSGRDSIREMREEADLLGIGLSKGFASSVELFNDNFSRFAAIGKGFTYQIMQALIPAVNEAANAFLDWYRRAAPAVLYSIRTGFDGIADSIRLVTKATGDQAGSMEIVGKVIGSVVLSLSGTFNTLYFYINASLAQTSAMLVAAMSLANKAAGYLGVGNVFDKSWIEDLAWTTKGLTERATEAYESIFKLRGQLGEIWSGSPGNKKAAGAVLDSLVSGFYDAKKGATDFGDAAAGAAGKVDDLWASIAKLNEEMIKQKFAGLQQGSAQSAGDWKYVTDVFQADTMEGAGQGGLGAILRDFSAQLNGALSPSAYGYDSFDASGAMGLGDLAGTVPGFGGIMQNWIDSVEMVDTAPLEDKLAYILDKVSFFGTSLREWSGFVSDSLVGFFADAATQGFKAAAMKFLAALVGMFGKIMAAHGAHLISQGMAEIAMGTAPPPFTRPDLIVHGKMLITKGTIMSVAGGIMAGASSILGGAMGGGSGGGSGTSFQSSIARPYGTTNQPVTVDVNKPGAGAEAGGVNVNLKVETFDSKSFDGWLKGGGDRVIHDSVGRAFSQNTRLREQVRNGLS